MPTPHSSPHKITLAAVATLFCICGLAACTAQTPQQTQSNSVDTAADFPSYEQTMAEFKQTIAEMNHITNPPEVEVVRYVDVDESAAVVQQCMVDKGIDAKMVGISSYTFPSEGAAGKAAALANYECQLMYPPDPKYHVPPTEKQAKNAYKWVTDYLIPCAAAFGVQTPSPPSEKKYVDDWLQQNEWQPLAGGDTQSSAAQKAQDQCLQHPRQQCS